MGCQNATNSLATSLVSNRRLEPPTCVDEQTPWPAQRTVGTQYMYANGGYE